MDRKSWIIVTLCVILMGVNWHYMQENQKIGFELIADPKKGKTSAGNLKLI